MSFVTAADRQAYLERKEWLERLARDNAVRSIVEFKAGINDIVDRVRRDVEEYFAGYGKYPSMVSLKVSGVTVDVVDDTSCIEMLLDALQQADSAVCEVTLRLPDKVTRDMGPVDRQFAAKTVIVKFKP